MFAIPKKFSAPAALFTQTFFPFVAPNAPRKSERWRAGAGRNFRDAPENHAELLDSTPQCDCRVAIRELAFGTLNFAAAGPARARAAGRGARAGARGPRAGAARRGQLAARRGAKRFFLARCDCDLRARL